MAITPITPLPAPPSRSNPTNFATTADAFMGAWPTLVTQVNQLAQEIEDFANLSIEAGGSAITAMSETSLTIGTGEQSLTVSTGKSFLVGQNIKIWNLENSSGMIGTVVSYNSETGAMVANIISVVGSGTFDDWVILASTAALSEIPTSPTETELQYPVTLGGLLAALGDANRFCPLDASSKVPVSNLPAMEVFPVGGIILWSGAASAIPTGWALCDGTNGTPDLRDRFVVGAGSTYAVNETGGSTSHTHGASIGQTTLTAAQMPYHNHGIQTGGNDSAAWINAGGSTGTWGNLYTTYAGSSSSHNHSATVDSATTRPPYYALCYIMKV